MVVALTFFLKIKCTKFYSDLIIFDIFTVQCLGVYFFYRTQCIKTNEHRIAYMVCT